MLRDVSSVDMRTCILGQEVAFPVCVAATAMQRMAHVDGELATARGSQILSVRALGQCFTLSLYKGGYLYDAEFMVYY